MDNSQYVKDYSDNSFFEKIKKTFSKAGVQVVYGALLLFYALKDPAVPAKAKATIVGALGYFITPLDLIPDLAPVVGYGDDLAAILTALGVVSIYLTPETKKKAKEKTKEWFGNVTEDEFDAVDSKL